MGPQHDADGHWAIGHWDVTIARIRREYAYEESGMLALVRNFLTAKAPRTHRLGP